MGVLGLIRLPTAPGGRVVWDGLKQDTQVSAPLSQGQWHGRVVEGGEDFSRHREE